MNTFRRLGCRYVQLFAPVEEITINYLGIRPTLYPVKVNEYKGRSGLRRRIWEVCVNTLRQCMHEHYEDCPWREQALYTMDSRNQMLCGYYAFGEYEFARASLVLISKGVRPDGLLSLCFPAGIDYPIPSFSLVYFIQVSEYIRFSGDLSLGTELYPMLKNLMQTFLSRIDESGLIKLCRLLNLRMVDRHEREDGEDNPGRRRSMRFVRGLGPCPKLRRSGQRAAHYRTVDAVARYWQTVYNHSLALNPTTTTSRASVLTNSPACFELPGDMTKEILRIMVSNGADNCGYVTIPNTLSMNSFRFDALLAIDRKKYAPIILAELDRDYGYMLDCGATSFWETIEGESAFKGAGSLCHGWSALPIYYYSILEGTEQDNL